MVQNYITGQIYAVSQSLVPHKGFIDNGKAIKNIMPISWGSMKVAKITDSGSLISVSRMVTNEDLQKVLEYIYFLEAQFKHYDGMVSEKVK